jgi:ribosomal protein S18 acetylase RimI-like enzyme
VTRTYVTFREGPDGGPDPRDRPLVDAAYDIWMDALGGSWPMDRDMFERYAGTCILATDGERGLGLVLPERTVSEARIRAIVVRPSAQRQGIGSALMREALRQLGVPESGGDTTATPPPDIRLGGGYRYIWPGIPDELSAARAFFRTWRSGDPSFDMTMRLDGFSAHPEFFRRPNAAGISFRTARPADMPQIVAFEERHFPGWTRYVRDHSPEDVVVGVDGAGRVLAALILDMPPILWYRLLGDRAAEIAAVGVDPEHHNLGIGTGLVAHACEVLRRRGVDVAVLRWLSRVNFYSRVGFTVWKQYTTGSWRLPPPASRLPTSEITRGRRFRADPGPETMQMSNWALHQHSLWPQVWHFLQPSSWTNAAQPQEGQISAFAVGAIERSGRAVRTAPSLTSSSNRSRYSSSTWARASGRDITRAAPKPTDRLPAIPLSWSTICWIFSR